MAKTRPGADRITKQTLTGERHGWQDAMAVHDDHCMQCMRADKDIYGRCTSWWAMARALHKVNRKLRKYEVAEVPASDMLPGMDELQ